MKRCKSENKRGLLPKHRRLTRRVFLLTALPLGLLCVVIPKIQIARLVEKLKRVPPPPALPTEEAAARTRKRSQQLSALPDILSAALNAAEALALQDVRLTRRTGTLLLSFCGPPAAVYDFLSRKDIVPQFFRRIRLHAEGRRRLYCELEVAHE